MTPDPHSTSHEGAHQVRPHRRAQGTIFTVAFLGDDEVLVANLDCPAELPTRMLNPGWYWVDERDELQGPFRTSVLAFVDATSGDFH